MNPISYSIYTHKFLIQTFISSIFVWFFQSIICQCKSIKILKFKGRKSVLILKKSSNWSSTRLIRTYSITVTLSFNLPSKEGKKLAKYIIDRTQNRKKENCMSVHSSKLKERIDNERECWIHWNENNNLPSRRYSSLYMDTKYVNLLYF